MTTDLVTRLLTVALREHASRCLDNPEERKSVALSLSYTVASITEDVKTQAFIRGYEAALKAAHTAHRAEAFKAPHRETA